MTYKKTMIAIIASAACLTAIPAHAVSQDDVAACRAATETRNYINLDEHRLRFKREVGKRQRTLEFEAIPTMRNAQGGRFKFSCTLNKQTVTALKTDSTIKLAKK